MTPRAAAVQGGLAALGLVLAYTTWQREPERAPGEVVVLAATRGDVERVHYQDGARALDVERGSGAVWVKQAASEDGKTPARTLRGGDDAEKLLAAFGPLRASRALGALEPAKVKELGLDDSRKKLEVTVRGGKRGFTVAAPGSGSFYLEDDQDRRVYLLAGPPLSDLDAGGARLIDRRLHDFPPAEVDAVTVVVGDKRRELVQTPPSRLAPKKDPTKIDELASNWHDKIWRLSPVEVLGKDEAPPDGAPAIALRVEYGGQGKSKGFIEIARVTPLMSTPEAPKPPALYARSEHTVGWVSLPAAADDVVKEAEKVVAGP